MYSVARRGGGGRANGGRRIRKESVTSSLQCSDGGVCVSGGLYSQIATEDETEEKVNPIHPQEDAGVACSSLRKR